MIEIKKGNESDIQAICTLAKTTWFATYAKLVPLEQIDYMLSLFYNEELLKEQLTNAKHHFLVMKENGILLGYSHCIEMESFIKLSKLYFSTALHGKGLGKRMMSEVEKTAKQLGFSVIELFVNRGNPAQYFYEKIGFTIMEEVDIPIGEYWMNDYRMQKILFEPLQ